jgi:Spy/CpxP family protein refolding chaperone
MRRTPPVAVIAFVASVTALVLSVPAAAFAKVGQEFQAQPQNPPPQGGGPLPGLDNGDMTPGEIQKLFDAYLVMEAQQALQLSDQQYPQFLTRLRTLQDLRRRTLQERNQLMGQLQRLTNPRLAKPVDESEIKARLTSLQELESRTAAEMRKAYNALDEVLDVRQQGRFRVFEEQIERRKIELLMRARQQNRLNNNPRSNQAPPKRPPPLD